MIIATDKLNTDHLRERLKALDTIEAADIGAFYQETDPGLNRSTLNWRIHVLVKKGVLERIGKGRYKLGTARLWQPEITPQMQSLYKRLVREFPYISVCIWNTSDLNEFMVHQPGRFYTLIEVDKEAAEAVFYWMKEANYKIVIDPSQDFIDKYLSGEQETIIIRGLVSEAPLQSLSGTSVPTLEKVLVDIYCDTTIFASAQGYEMRTIFREACLKYSVNQDKMFRYATRRGKREAFRRYFGS